MLRGLQKEKQFPKKKKTRTALDKGRIKVGKW